MMNSIQFDLTVEAGAGYGRLAYPPDVYKRLMDGSLVVAGYTNELMASRFPMSCGCWIRF